MYRRLLLLLLVLISGSGGTRVLVVSHHKTGTAASLEVVAALCCPEAYAISRLEQFWAVWWGICRRRCLDRRPKVEFAFDGLIDRGTYHAAPAYMLRAEADPATGQEVGTLARDTPPPAPNASAPADPTPDLTPDLTVVHFLRHPIDIVVRGARCQQLCALARLRLWLHVES